MRSIVFLAEVFGDGTGFLDDEVTVFDGRGFAQWCWDFGAEVRWGEAVGGAVSGDEVVGEREGGEEPGDADGARGVEEVEGYIWAGGHGEGGIGLLRRSSRWLGCL